MALLGESESEFLSDKLVVVSSDFKRARETAEIMHQHFIVKAPLRLEHGLRERDFGELNMTDSSNYQKVWSQDAHNPNHTSFGCETVTNVLSHIQMMCGWDCAVSYTHLTLPTIYSV